MSNNQQKPHFLKKYLKRVLPKYLLNVRHAISRIRNEKLLRLREKRRRQLINLTNNFYVDVSRRFPMYLIEPVFDVGANIGQSVDEIVRQYGNIQVHAFEPVTSSYQILQSKHAKSRNVNLYQLAFGSFDGEVEVTANGTSTGNQIVHNDDAPGQTERVRCEKIDTFCDQHNIKTIGLLKIDTEGYDFDVLLGAKRLIKDSMINIIKVELGFSPLNKKHVSVDRVRLFLANYGYQVFGVYDQVLEFDGSPILRRADLVFISPRVIECCKVIL